MDFQHLKEDAKGSFKAIENGIDAGIMTYSCEGTDRIIIEHTEVNPEFKGQGIGKQLLLKAIDFARENNIKIIPLCSYVKSVFDKTPEFADVL